MERENEDGHVGQLVHHVVQPAAKIRRIVDSGGSTSSAVNTVAFNDDIDNVSSVTVTGLSPSGGTIDDSDGQASEVASGEVPVVGSRNIDNADTASGPEVPWQGVLASPTHDVNGSGSRTTDADSTGGHTVVEMLNKFETELLARVVAEAQTELVDYISVLEQFGCESPEARAAILKPFFRQKYMDLLTAEPFGASSFCASAQPIFVGNNKLEADHISAVAAFNGYLLVARTTDTLKKYIDVYMITAEDRVLECRAIKLPAIGANSKLTANSHVVALRVVPGTNTVLACVRTDGLDHPYRVDRLDLGLMTARKSVVLQSHGPEPANVICCVTVGCEKFAYSEDQLITVDRSLRVVIYSGVSGLSLSFFTLPSPPLIVGNHIQVGVLQLPDRLHSGHRQRRILVLQPRDDGETMLVSIVKYRHSKTTCKMVGETEFMESSFGIMDSLGDNDERTALVWGTAGRGALIVYYGREWEFLAPHCVCLFPSLDRYDVIPVLAAFDRQHNQYFVVGRDGVYRCRSPLL